MDPAEESDVPVTSSISPTCTNGFYEAGELCVTNPGTLVLDTSNQQVLTVLAVDVNADGRRDLVAVTTSRVWVRYRTSAGFGNVMSLSTAGAAYTDVVAADFDNDGDLDLAVSDAGTNRVIVWRNNGGLLFPVWTTVNVGANPVRLLSHRLDADARPDLVVLSRGAQVATVILSPFVASVAYPAGDTQDIALGDCDNDAHIDLLYTNGRGTGTQLRARRSLVTGALTAPITSALPLYDVTYGYLDPFAIAAGDFNNDGISEAVVSASWSRLATTIGTGGCMFTPTYNATNMNTTWAWVPARLRTYDWNVDGNLDLSAPHGFLGGGGEEVYTIAFGNGFGRFPAGVHEPHPADTVIPKDMAYYDASGDGRVDVLVAADIGVVLETRLP